MEAWLVLVVKALTTKEYRNKVSTSTGTCSYRHLLRDEAMREY